MEHDENKPSVDKATDAGTTVPRFEYARKVRQRDLSSLDSGYSPVLLLKEEEDLTLKDIFDNEVRDDKYASAFEARIRDSYRGVIEHLGVAEKVRTISVECRTLSCFTYIQVDRKDSVEMYNTVGRFSSGPIHSPDLVDDEDPSLANITFYTIFEPKMRDPREFEAYVGPLIESQLKAYRAEREASTPR